ncbi:MAG: hypothetical protein KC449_11415, partial [Anaerolineales bacterium]|nr:hypothetical protein [Anaerolineales bacterium]
MKNEFRKLTLILIALLAMLALISCGGGDETTDTTQEPAADSDAPAAEVTGKVGIVLPTKDEPRWVQDEGRFQEALEAAGYDVEILFS